MKSWLKNLVSFSLVLIYSISLSIYIQDFLIDTILNDEQNHDISISHSDSKIPVFYLVSDLEPLGDYEDTTVDNLRTTELKSDFQLFKNVELYILTKDNQYLYKSKNIHPGLDIDALLYPFHTFS